MTLKEMEAQLAKVYGLIGEAQAAGEDINALAKEYSELAGKVQKEKVAASAGKINEAKATLRGQIGLLVENSPLAKLIGEPIIRVGWRIDMDEDGKPVTDDDGKVKTTLLLNPKSVGRGAKASTGGTRSPKFTVEVDGNAMSPKDYVLAHAPDDSDPGGRQHSHLKDLFDGGRAKWLNEGARHLAERLSHKVVEVAKDS